MRLRGGFETSDPRLDRVVEFDERSRGYPIRMLIAARKPRSYTWKIPVRLNQKSEGACCGFGWAAELAGRPLMVPNVDNELARAIYREAQRLDAWPGEAYGGTSVIAAAKAVRARGHIKEFRWAFGLEDLVLALGY